MTNDELTPAEALRALADGETLESSDHYEGVIENGRLVIRHGETGGLYCVVPLKWRRRIPVQGRASGQACRGDVAMKCGGGLSGRSCFGGCRWPI